MGTAEVRSPNTEKICQDDYNENIKYGLCEMQGWRGSMVLFYLI